MPWDGALPHTADCRYCAAEGVTVRVRYAVSRAGMVDAMAEGCPHCGTPLVTTEEAEALVEAHLIRR